MPGTGGARKVRFSRPGEGKRGGYRIITFFYCRLCRKPTEREQQNEISTYPHKAQDETRNH